MKRITRFRRSTTLTMILAMSVHIFSGFGVFCDNKALRPLRSLGIFPVSLEIASAGSEGRLKTRTDRVQAESPGKTSPRCCKMMKRCPAIPRGTTSSIQTNRLHEAQLETRSGNRYARLGTVSDHRLTAKAGGPLAQLARCRPIFWFDPLALTTTLLI